MELIETIKNLNFTKYVSSTPVETYYIINDTYSILIENNIHVFLYNRYAVNYIDKYINIKSLEHLSEMFLKYVGESLEPRLRYLKINKIKTRL
jgi:hypothetical protein